MQQRQFRSFSALLAIASAALAGPVLAAPFTAGDIAVYRVGTGAAATTSASTAVFIDEYTPAGTLVQSIAMPTAAGGGNFPLTASGSATSEGLLSLSADGRFLVLSGYGAAPGVASIAGTSGTSTPRIAGLIDPTGAIDTTTALSDFSSGNNARSAISADGGQVWVGGGAGGVRYAAKGATTSTQLSTTVANTRQLEIYAGQLYTSSSSSSVSPVRVGAIGTGEPTTAGQTIVNLPGVPPSTGSPYAFVLLHLTAGGAGLNTLYVADDALGVLKYSLVGGSWVANGTATGKYRGLIATTDGSNVNLFASIDGEIDTLSDTSGYNATLTATPVKIVTAASNTLLRGIAFAPQNPVPQLPHATFATPSDFGSVNVGASSTPQTLTLSNDGNADLHVTAVTANGDFQVGSDGCSNTTVSAGTHCTFAVVFSPSQPGSRSGQLTLSSDSNPAATAQTLSGTGVALPTYPHASLSTPADFGSVLIGSSSAPQTITVNNDGDADLHITAANVSGDFALTADSCSNTTVVAGASCSFGVTFTPTTPGSRTGSASVASDSSPAASVQNLSGTGVAPPTPVLGGLPVAFSGVIGDPTDYTFGAYARGLNFSVTENGDAAPCSDLSLSVSSSNTTVLPNSGLILDACSLDPNNPNQGLTALHIDPASEGYADITVTATDTANRSVSTVLHYAASSAWAAPGATSTIWPTGDSDASAAQALGDDYTLVGGDENQVLRIYSRLLSGPPISGTDVTPSLGLTGTVDDYEVDIEATTRDPADPNRVYWSGSHGNSKKGNRKPNRERIFATDLSGSADTTTLAVAGYYEHLRDDLVAWDHGNGHSLGADFLGLAASSYTDGSGANGIPPKSIDGFNIEGVSFSPDGSLTWLGFRAPLLPATGAAARADPVSNPRQRALLVPMTNFATLASGAGGHATGQATFGTPILLDLGGLGVREIQCNTFGCLIAAGPFDGTDDMGALYTWSGNPADAPVRRTANLVGLNVEGIVALPAHPLLDTDVLELVSDEGSRNFYDPTQPVDGDDDAAKSLPYDAWKKARIDQVTLGAPDVIFRAGFESN